jgi:alpha-tubulin suppressor-like RCC1 family protein
VARQVATGNEHSCALLDDDTVKCWGRNDYGQLGLGDTVNRGVTVEQMGDALPVVPLGEAAQAVSAGVHHTCALLRSGAVKCWGLNDAGQLGQGTAENLGDAANELANMPAIRLGSGRTAIAIDVGVHSCALLDDGAVKCWGSNANGELGQGDVAARGATPGTMGDALKEIDLGE